MQKENQLNGAVLQSIKNWGYTKDDFVYCSELPNSTEILMLTLPSILVGAKIELLRSLTKTILENKSLP